MAILIIIEEGMPVEVGEALIIEEVDMVKISNNRDNTNQINSIGDTTILHTSINYSNNNNNLIHNKTRLLLFRHQKRVPRG
jgi:hypothetical protein